MYRAYVNVLNLDNIKIIHEVFGENGGREMTELSKCANLLTFHRKLNKNV